MSNQINLEGEREKENKEDIRVGYRLATDLWINTDQHFWSMYNTMIVANSILIASVGWLFSTDHPRDPDLLSLLSYYVIPILGLILCSFWFIMAVRAATYRRYYIFTARELEEKYLNVNILSRGGKIQTGEPIEIELRNEPKPRLKMPYIGRFHDTWSSYIIISLFSIVYLIILIKGVFFSGDNNFWYIFNRMGGEMQLDGCSFRTLWIITCIFGALGISIIGFSICKIAKECEVRKLEGYKTISVLGGIITIVSILALAYIAYLRS
jgi:hypothetical protein